MVIPCMSEVLVVMEIDSEMMFELVLRLTYSVSGSHLPLPHLCSDLPLPKGAVGANVNL